MWYTMLLVMSCFKVYQLGSSAHSFSNQELKVLQCFSLPVLVKVFIHLN